jgi:hypothetical protein
MTHNARININYVQEQFGKNWIGTWELIQRPARSPDLSPLDFFP